MPSFIRFRFSLLTLMLLILATAFVINWWVNRDKLRIVATLRMSPPTYFVPEPGKVHDASEHEQFVATQLKLITSESVLERVIPKLSEPLSTVDAVGFL